MSLLNVAKLFTGKWLDSCCEFHLSWKIKEHSRQRTIKYKGLEAERLYGHGFPDGCAICGQGAGALRTDSVGMRRDDQTGGLLGPVQEFAAYPDLGEHPEVWLQVSLLLLGENEPERRAWLLRRRRGKGKDGWRKGSSPPAFSPLFFPSSLLPPISSPLLLWLTPPNTPSESWKHRAGRAVA